MGPWFPINQIISENFLVALYKCDTSGSLSILACFSYSVWIEHQAGRTGDGVSYAVDAKVEPIAHLGKINTVQALSEFLGTNP